MDIYENGKLRNNKILVKYGYIYTLVEGKDRTNDGREINPFPQPCFMGHKNYALYSVKKIGA